MLRITKDKPYIPVDNFASNGDGEKKSDIDLKREILSILNPIDEIGIESRIGRYAFCSDSWSFADVRGTVKFLLCKPYSASQ